MTPKELFQEIDAHLLQDESPSEYLRKAAKTETFDQFPFELLNRMKHTKQSPIYHPEGSVWVHTLMVVDEAAKYRARSGEPRAFMWAAFLHDIGKPPTTRVRKGKITSYDHDIEGERLAREFLNEFTRDEPFIEEVCGLVRYHMQILYVAKKAERAQLEEMKRRVDIREAALMGLCDRIGRGNVDVEKEQESIRQFLKICGAQEEGF